MVPVRRVEQAGDSPWIWCVLGGLQLWAKRKTHQQREDCSEYDISSFHDLIFPFLLLLFWPSLISRWRTQFRLFVLPGPKQYPNPRAVLPEMQMRCQEERLSFFFGGRKKARSTAFDRRGDLRRGRHGWRPWRPRTGHINLSPIQQGKEGRNAGINQA